MTCTTQTLVDLQRQIDELKAELERRDIEQIAVENAIEFLHRQAGTHHYVLGWVAASVLGRTKGDGKTIHEMLYPESTAGLAFHQARAMVYERPARRWTQFGTKTELKTMATEAGIKLKCWHTRRDIVEQLWDRRLLPGSVALYRTAVLVDTA